MVLKISGQADVAADRARVWEALHEVSCLKPCIPGCRTIERVSLERYELTVRVGIGPIALPVAGAVQIHESDEPRLLCLKAASSGAMAGLIGGQLRLTLIETPSGCRIAYLAEIQPKGAFAALGADLLTFGARRLVDRFVVTFAATVGASQTLLQPAAVPRMTTDPRH